MIAPAKPRRRLFWYVYLHGLLMLGVVTLSVGGLVRLLGHLFPFNTYAEQYAHSLAARGDAAWDDPQALDSELRQERARTGVEMTVRRLDGELIASSVNPALPALREPLEIGRLRREGAVTHGVLRSGRPLQLSFPLPDRDEPTAYITVAVPLALPVVERVTFSLAVLLGLMALISVPLARLISRPMEKLTTTARALGGGDLSVRSGIRRRDEVGELAGAFDEMAERLQRLVRGEKDLLANVSHELRTPLARISVALDLAAEADPQKLKGYLQEMRTDVADLDRLVNDVLTAARLDVAVGAAGLPPLKREPIGAGELIDCSARHFRECHPERALSVELSAPLPNLDADRALMRRALDNVLENAWKYSDAGEPIAIRAHAEEGTAVIDISDRGIGIDPEDLPRLFTPFFRTDRSRARGTGGVGLGLALARRIVEAHGGQIAVESSPGRHTRVRFTLPSRPGPG